MPRYMRKPYKYGGKTVPGMYKAQDGREPRFDVPSPTNPIGRKPKFNPYTHFKTKQEYNAWVNSGSPDISTYVPSNKFLVPRTNIFDTGTPSPFPPTPPSTPVTPPVIPPSYPVSFPEMDIDPRTGGRITRKRGGSIRRRGGSTGPNGIL